MPAFKDVVPDNTYNAERRGVDTFNVFSADDLTFPLAAGRYILKNDVTVSVPITTAIASTVYIESDGGGRTLTLDGTGDLVTGNATFGILVMRDMNVSITGTSANLFNLDNVIFNAEKVNYLFTATEGQSIGTINNSLLSVSLLDCIFNGFQDGLTVDNIAERYIVDRSRFVSDTAGTGDLLTIGSSVGSVQMNGIEVSLADGETIFNINNALVTTVTIEKITNSNVNTVFFNAAGLDQDSKYIDVSKCEPEQESTVSIEILSENMATTTDIPAANAKIIMNASGFTVDEQNRLTIDAKGVATTGSLAPQYLKLDGNVYFEPLSSTKNLSCGFFGLLVTEYTVTFDNATNIVNEVGTALADNDIICFYDTAGTLPTELRDDALYYVVNKTTDTFQLSYTMGGAAIAFTDNGTPTNSYKTVELHGSKPKEPIAANSPRTLVPQALLFAVPDEKIGIYQSNLDDTVNILNTDAYYRVNK